MKKVILIGLLLIMGIGLVSAQTHDHNVCDMFESGQEYGQHVAQHAQMLDGHMNPGVHHQGYSWCVP